MKEIRNPRVVVIPKIKEIIGYLIEIIEERIELSKIIILFSTCLCCVSSKAFGKNDHCALQNIFPLNSLIIKVNVESNR